MSGKRLSGLVSVMSGGVSVRTYSECGRFQTGFVFCVYLLWILSTIHWIVLLLVLI